MLIKQGTILRGGLVSILYVKVVPKYLEMTILAFLLLGWMTFAAPFILDFPKLISQPVKVESDSSPVKIVKDSDFKSANNKKSTSKKSLSAVASFDWSAFSVKVNEKAGLKAVTIEETDLQRTFRIDGAWLLLTDGGRIRVSNENWKMLSDGIGMISFRPGKLQVYLDHLLTTPEKELEVLERFINRYKGWKVQRRVQDNQPSFAQITIEVTK